tara:strand:- start:11299 stop:12300 length:1002 start_codon:yes stop_codon:yes gene_type:complete
MQKRIISVIGIGSWGATMAQYLSSLGHSITGWHRNTAFINQLKIIGKHPSVPNLRFNPDIALTSNLNNIPKSDIVMLGIPSHAMKSICKKFRNQFKDTIIVNLAKGIENDSLKRMSEIINDEGDVKLDNIITLSGPSHAEEVVKNIPTTVVAAGINQQSIELIQDTFSSKTFRVYASTDILGVELGGSVKNIIAIAAGICDGIGFGDNTKSALITRGIVEIKRLGIKMGAVPETFAGLSGIGDLIATCLSSHSRNRFVGEEIGRGNKLTDILEKMEVVAEGVNSTKSVYELMQKNDVEMPICSAIFSVLFMDEDPVVVVNRLMTRDLTYEIDS